MKKRFFWASLVCLTFGIIVYTSNESFASSDKSIEKLDCKNDKGTIVSHGAACQNGLSGCIANACPQGSSQQ